MVPGYVIFTLGIFLADSAGEDITSHSKVKCIQSTASLERHKSEKNWNIN